MVVALLPPAAFVISWILALLGVDAAGAADGAPLDENALRWILFWALGWSLLGGAIAHTVFARGTAESIGWPTSGFQYEVGFASLGMGLAAIYASIQDSSEAWIAASIAGGLFLLFAGFNHVREILADRNFSPGNTLILLSDFGVPISLVALLFATNSI